MATASTRTVISSARSICFASLLALASLGCASEPLDPEHVDYEEIRGVPGLLAPTSACELFAGPRALGVFRIDELVGSLERDPSGAEVPRIRVTAHPEEIWVGEVGPEVSFAIDGGYARSGAFLAPALSLTRGERVVLVLLDGEADPVQTELQVWHERSADRFSNGQLFTDSGVSAAELRAIVDEVRASETCPFPSDFGLPPG